MNVYISVIEDTDIFPSLSFFFFFACGVLSPKDYLIFSYSICYFKKYFILLIHLEFILMHSKIELLFSSRTFKKVLELS